MANADRPMGLRPVRYRDGRPWTGAANKYYVPSTDTTAMYIGDPVQLAGAGDTPGAYGTVSLATGSTASTGYCVGVIVGFDPVEGVSTPNLSVTYRAASTAMYAYVADDPDLMFEAQDDDGSLVAADIGNNVNFTTATAGSTTFGLSGVELDASTNATTALQLRLHGIVDRPDNALGTSAKWLVSFNLHRNRYSTGV